MIRKIQKNRDTVSLSKQFQKHLKDVNDDEKISTDDKKAFVAIRNAEQSFNEYLKGFFSPITNELKRWGYPNTGTCEIDITTELSMLNSLNHRSAVQYKSGENFLPEFNNGLGYRNLISMFFKLTNFRDVWAKKTDEFRVIIHLVIVEEPEVHLHAQIQKAFVDNSYATLNNDIPDTFKTQMLISTHSSHMANEIDFKNIRYLRRKSAENKFFTEIVNLEKTFGTDTKTEKFVSKYIRLSHCDLFFADGVIMVEGSVEKMLMPIFIDQADTLNQKYISILEITGSYAHLFKPLMDKLKIPTVIITDIDSVCDSKSTFIQRGNGQKTANPALKTILEINEIDKLLSLNKKRYGER